MKGDECMASKKMVWKIILFVISAVSAGLGLSVDYIGKEKTDEFTFDEQNDPDIQEDINTEQDFNQESPDIDEQEIVYGDIKEFDD
jgi:hypothetical protein